jgi:hypothetical protein
VKNSVNSTYILKSGTNRELEDLSKGEKYSKMDKGAKDKLAGSPGKN